MPDCPELVRRQVPSVGRSRCVTPFDVLIEGSIQSKPGVVDRARKGAFAYRQELSIPCLGGKPDFKVYIGFSRGFAYAGHSAEFRKAGNRLTGRSREGAVCHDLSCGNSCVVLEGKLGEISALTDWWGASRSGLRRTYTSAENRSAAEERHPAKQPEFCGGAEIQFN